MPGHPKRLCDFLVLLLVLVGSASSMCVKPEHAASTYGFNFSSAIPEFELFARTRFLWTERLQEQKFISTVLEA